MPTLLSISPATCTNAAANTEKGDDSGEGMSVSCAGEKGEGYLF